MSVLCVKQYLNIQQIFIFSIKLIYPERNSLTSGTLYVTLKAEGEKIRCIFLPTILLFWADLRFICKKDIYYVITALQSVTDNPGADWSLWSISCIS